jgi:adenine C2-methylase RlmN of 23S rRNA A2503 and tRNA A37
MAGRGGITTNNAGVRKRRKAPFPQNSILDRAALQEALDSRGISLKRLHMDAFYQALHRQHYPPLPQFVETYYKYEDVNNTLGNNDSKDDTTTTETSIIFAAPLKNKVSSKKCKNKLQLPKAFLEYLRTTNEFVTMTSKIKKELTSQNTLTTKLVIELYDGQVIESVLMRFDSKGVGRASLCVSSQCGCAMGCTFCATGTMGLSGNLTSAEILEQLVHANSILAKDYYVSSLQEQQQQQVQQEQQQEQEDPNVVAGHGNGNNITSNNKKTGTRKRGLHLVRNVVFMGQGEPLDNYTHVVNACRAMMDTRRWNLKHEHVTISTVGLVSQIRKLTKDLPEVSLALSLHAPNQALRTSIVPTASRYPIESLIDALDHHMLAGVVPTTNPSTATTTGRGDSTTAVVVTEEDRIKASSKRRAMIEYVMCKSFSCSIR